MTLILIHMHPLFAVRGCIFDLGGANGVLGVHYHATFFKRISDIAYIIRYFRIIHNNTKTHTNGIKIYLQNIRMVCSHIAERMV